MNNYVEMIEKRLSELFDIDRPSAANDKADNTKTLLHAMEYSVLAGGKRFRPTLCLMANSLLLGDNTECLDIACAIELIHTYSLIHDDLPAMDNDSLRRGKPTNHVVFGEAGAILAGDALLNMAYEIMLGNAKKYPQNLNNHILAIEHIAKASGCRGMVLGQWEDINNIDNAHINEETIKLIYSNKTGALITASLLSGLQLCSPTEEQASAIKTFGDNLGLMFQITDDILDIVGKRENIGKTPGKDLDRNKTTFISIHGMEKTKEYLGELTEQAISCIKMFDFTENLIDLTYFMGNRAWGNK